MEEGEDLDENRYGGTDQEPASVETDVNEPLSLEDGRRPLIVAAARGDVKEVKALLDLGAFADMPDYKGNTALHHAVQEGHVEVVKVLVEHFSNLNIYNCEYLTPLSIAYKNDQRQILKILLAKGSDDYCHGVNWCELMLTAFEENDEDLIELLKKIKVDVSLEEATRTENLDLVKYALDGLSTSDCVYSKNKTINRSFNLAIGTGTMELVELFLNYGVDLKNRIDVQMRYTPLLVALFKGMFEIADRLIEKGANIDSFALHEAIKLGNNDAVDFLLNKKVDVNQKDNRGMTPIHIAVEENDVQIVRRLIENQANLNSTNINQESPLCTAIRKKQIEMVRLLLDNRAFVNSNKCDDVSPIYLAVTENQFEIVELLIDKKSNLNIKTTDGETLLSIALRKNSTSMANALIDAGARIDYKSSLSLLSGCSLLHLAIWNGDVDMCKKLLSKGAPADSTTKEGNTPLMCAIYRLQDQRSFIDIIKVLIDLGANVKVENSDGLQAINLAAKLSDHQLVEWLIEKGAVENINENNCVFDLLSDSFTQGHDALINKILECDTDFNGFKDAVGRTCLHLAVIWGRINCIKVFLSKGVPVNVQDNNNNTPSHFSCRSSSRSVEVVKVLLENGADFNLLNNSGFSPLHNVVSRLGEYSQNSYEDSLCRLLIEQESFVDCADPNGRTMCHALAEGNHVDLMRLYLDRGNVNHINTQDRYGNTPFHLAVLHGHTAILNLISRYVLNPDIKNKDGFTPLQLALRIARAEQNVLVNIILEQGVDINLQNDFGETALHIAVHQNSLVMTKLLLERGADLSIKDKEGNTVLHKAVFAKSKSLSEFLLKCIASSVNGADKDLHCYTQSLVEETSVNNALTKCNFVNASNNLGNTPLHYAVGFNLEEIVQLLIDNAADINTTDLEGFSPLMTAARQGNIKMVEYLFNLGAVIDLSDPTLACTLLNDAIRSHHNFLIEHLLKNEININWQDKKGNTAIHAASEIWWNPALILRLLDRGANVNIVNEEGETAFLIATRRFGCETVECFLDKGANVDTPNKHQETALHITARHESSNCLEIGEMLIKRGANVNALNDRNQTPLLYAVILSRCRFANSFIEKLLDFIILLLENGADPNIADDDGNTVLNIAMERMYNSCVSDCEENCTSIQIVKLLVDKGARVENYELNYFEFFLNKALRPERTDVFRVLTEGELDRHGKHMMLYVSIQKKCYELVDRLLSKGMEWDTSCVKCGYKTPFCVSLWTRDDKLVDIFFKREKHLSSFDLDSANVLHRIHSDLSAVSGSLDRNDLLRSLSQCRWGEALMLLDRGISLDVTDEEGCSPLQLAVKNGSLAIVKILLRKEVHVDQANNYGETALHTACQRNRVAIARVLIENKASILDQDFEGRTPLHVVNYDKDTTDLWEIVNLLIDAGAPVDKTDSKSNTVLHMCSGGESSRVAKLLMERGASVHARDNYGFTPLHCTTSAEVAKELVEHGAQVNVKDASGNSPLHKCAWQNLEITKVLLDNNAIVDERNNQRETPLWMAVHNYSKERNDIVKLLIEKGADCRVKTTHSLLDTAISEKFNQLQYLLDNGANVDNCHHFQRFLENPYSTTLHLTSYNMLQYPVLIKHIYKLKLAGLPVQYCLQMIESILPLFGDEINDTFFVTCLKELDEIRSTDVYSGFTLGDIVTNYKKPYFLLEEDLVENLEALLQSPSFPEQFPTYGFILRNVYRELKSRRFYLLHLASLSMMKETRTLHCNLLTEDAKIKIFQYLSDEDLQNLIKSDVLVEN